MLSGQMKYAWQDHDPAELDQAPPVQNTWYEVCHIYNARVLYVMLIQTNTENGVKNVEVRWTCDGTVYFISDALAEALAHYIAKSQWPSYAGTDGLFMEDTTTLYNANKIGFQLAALYTDKRALDFKVEIRMTSAPGTNQHLNCTVVYETLEGAV